MRIREKVLQVPFVDLAAQRNAVAEEIDTAIANVLDSTAFILGQEVSHFEEDFATFCETKWAVGVDTGTSALELALRAYGIGPGQEVITVANTFIATVLAIIHVGATPVLVDIDPQTYTMDPAKLEGVTTDRTRAIIPVHLYGQPADMDPILDFAHRHNLVVIEDACQAHGAKYKGSRVASLGHAAAFSFYPSKNLGAYGDGGMVVTNDEHVAETIRMLRNYGQSEKYQHLLVGYNRRLDTLQAAVLRIKLKHLEEWNTARRGHAELYNQLLASSEVIRPVEAPYAESVWHLYVIRVEKRDALITFLAERGISVGIHYPIPVHLQPALRHLNYKKQDFPISEMCAEQIVSLPMYPELKPEQIEHVADTISEFILTS